MYQVSFMVMPERADASWEGLLRHFAERLQAEQYKRVCLSEDAVSFSSRNFGFVGWSHVRGITHGEIHVSPEYQTVAFRLNCLQQLIACTILAAFPGLILALARASAIVWLTLPVAWLWFYGTSSLLIRWVFRRFVCRCIREAGFVVDAKT